MSDFTNESFESLEELSRIYATEEEKEKLLSSLKTILDYVDKLQAIPTDGVKGSSHPTLLSGKNHFREDVVEKTLDRELFLKNAPDQIGGMIRTPSVISEEP